MKEDLKKELLKRNGNFQNKEDFNYVTLANPEEFLNYLAKSGYVFHGSTREIVGKLIPKQANDLSKEFGNREAIYLTSTPIIAMFTALTGGVNVGVRRNSVISKIDEDGNYHYPTVYFGVLKTKKIKSTGYVYIFPEDVIDESEEGEYISLRPIRPELIVKIEREDFRFPIEKLDIGAKGGI